MMVSVALEAPGTYKCIREGEYAITSTPLPVPIDESCWPSRSTLSTVALPSEQPTNRKPRVSSSAIPRDPAHPLFHLPTMDRARTSIDRLVDFHKWVYAR